jgi:hypothetical protein
MKNGLGFDLRRFHPERPPALLLGGLNLVRALGLAGIPAIVASPQPDSPARASRFAHGGLLLPPLEQRDAVLETLVRAGERIGLCFVNPGSIDASRKRGPRLAECALFDSRHLTVEFLRVPYDSAASEAKAAVFGYRISALAEELYSLRRRTAGAARRLGARLRG